ncbi:glycosyltransferase family 2 protein [Mariniflexile sp. HNIBRBA6329]|uniref:glycosyltransferase family 2 protein n=1 Tax=Mariniflexile sp. HNIBRBA6329 TaxID=3373088 RepID=UPI003744B8D9
MDIELSVIIVNYNGVSFFKKCFDSLKENLSGVSFEIIVVDNNSTDNSCDFLRINFPEVKLIASGENLGFGRGNNLGVENAQGKTILLLNNDTIIQNHLSPALKTLYKNDETGIVSINMLNANKEYISAVGRFPSPFKLLKISFLNDTRNEFKTGKFNLIQYDVDWVSGAFMLIRKADYEAINGFDADYFMYVEDVDLCRKMKNIGKKCVFQANLSYIHFVGFNKSRENLLLKGYKIYASKHFSKTGCLIAKSMISVNRFVKGIKYKKK